MKKLLRNFLAVILVGGVIASCETTDPLIQEAQKNIVTQNYDSALAILDRSIAQNPKNGVPHYYKALTYAQKASTLPDPHDRKPVYENFRESIITARDIFETQEEAPSEAGEVQNLIYNTWGIEHNASIEYVNDDSIRATVNEPLKYSVAHLKNAITVNPDSTLSWDILGQVQYMDNNLEGAIEATLQAMELKSPPPSSDYLRLGIYYAEIEQVEEAISILNKGLEVYPDSINLAQNLADAYMRAGERDKSIGTIQSLIDSDPENAQYRLALATQILQTTSELSERISDNFDMIYDLRSESRSASSARQKEISAKIDSIFTVNDEYSADVNTLSARAEEELLKVTELRPNDDLAYNYLGIAYQNKYATLFEKRNVTTDNDLANEYDQQAKAELRKAMEYYEKAAEINPDRTEYWDILSRIYTTLDMLEKAEEALEKAGM